MNNTQYNVLWNCTPETYINLLTGATPINSIKRYLQKQNTTNSSSFFEKEPKETAEC